MTAKEKAEELIDKFGSAAAAIICVDEVIELLNRSALRSAPECEEIWSYWVEVKSEIKLSSKKISAQFVFN